MLLAHAGGLNEVGLLFVLLDLVILGSLLYLANHRANRMWVERRRAELRTRRSDSSVDSEGS